MCYRTFKERFFLFYLPTILKCRLYLAHYLLHCVQYEIVKYRLSSLIKCKTLPSTFVSGNDSLAPDIIEPLRLYAQAKLFICEH